MTRRYCLGIAIVAGYLGWTEVPAVPAVGRSGHRRWASCSAGVLVPDSNQDKGSGWLTEPCGDSAYAVLLG